MSSRSWSLAAALLALAACTPSPEPVRPALWQVEGPQGQRAWLFGTIHALARPADLHSPAFDRAWGEADRLVMEVAAIDDDARTAQFFTELARTPGQPPLAHKVPAELAPALAALLRQHGIAPEGFADVETWAVALTLNQALQADFGSDSGNGIDRQLLRERGARAVGELEGARAQLAIFDGLSEADQRELLAEVVRSAEGGRAEALRLEQAWKRGDLAALAAMTGEGLLAGPELREALLAGRNRAWAARLTPMISAGEEPFVAVGALHLAGPDGLPTLLEARGFRVTRLQ